MPSSSIDFSAQFGGRNAAAAVLPHFKALKAAARGVELSGFPFPVLAFILRVDGEVAQYGLSGAGNVDVDKSGEYVSVDIGITIEDREKVLDVVTAAIRSSVAHIRCAASDREWKVDFETLERCLRGLTVRYKNELS